MCGVAQDSMHELDGLRSLGNGVWCAPGARLIDRAGRRKLPIGEDGFARAMAHSTLVDKTMLVADVLDANYKVTLFCRPRRFGKTLNMTMLKAFFEAPNPSDATWADPSSLFAGTQIWDASNGHYRSYAGSNPVVHVSLNTVKSLDWETALEAIGNVAAAEYGRHGYLADSSALTPGDRALFSRICSGTSDPADLGDSLLALCRMLRAHHGRDVVLLVDEYDAPAMAGHTHGYYQEVVAFLKRWLTGALKDGGTALAFAVLTGVQRITKESVFSDLNNLTVSTPLTTVSDERFGFTDAEVSALAAYLGHDPASCMDEAREWYDGYRFGNADVYNPWSALNYFDRGCVPGVYWLNTSSNSVVAAAVRAADSATLGQLYDLVKPGGVVYEPLDLGVVFPDVGVRPEAAWAMLYLAGYLTTDDVTLPDDPWVERALRIPNRELLRLFSKEIPLRFLPAEAGERGVRLLHRALRGSNEDELRSALADCVHPARGLTHGGGPAIIYRLNCDVTSAG